MIPGLQIAFWLTYWAVTGPEDERIRWWKRELRWRRWLRKQKELTKTSDGPICGSPNSLLG